MVDTIKFSQMTDGGTLSNDNKTPGLKSGENVLFNNPWTFLPPGTTAERPLPSATINYRLRFNTEDQLYEYYDAVLGMWTQLQESAFTQGPFITYTASVSLPDAQNLGALADGILKQSITLGVATLDIAVNGTDYWAPGDALTRTQAPVVGDDVTNKTYVDAQIAGAVTSVQGTANQVLVNATTGIPQTGDLTLTLPQDINITSSPTFDNLQLSGGLIIGADGTTVFELINTALSVNYIRATSQPTGINPSLSAQGTDTDISLTLAAKGAGGIALMTAALTQPLLIYSGTSNQHITRFNMANTAQDRSVTWQDSDGTVAWLADIPSVTPSALTKTDDTNVTLTLGGSPSVALLAATSLTLGWTGLLGFSRGGTNVSATPTTASASNFAAWDASVNLPANNFLPGYATTVTAAATTTLTVASANQQFFTGSTTQTVVMPVTSTLVLGQPYKLVNNSSGAVTVNSSGGNNILTMAANTVAFLTCILTSGTSAASWYYELVDQNEGGGVTSVGTGTGLTGGPITSTGTISVTGALASIFGLTTTSQELIYTTASDTYAVLAPSANKVLFCNASGNIQWSANVFLDSVIGADGTTLMSFFDVASAVNSIKAQNAITGNPVSLSADGSDTNIELVLQSKGNKGVAVRGCGDGSTAVAGYVGEQLSQAVAYNAVSLTTSTTANVATVTLTPGEWEYTSYVLFSPDGTTTITFESCGVNSVSATLPNVLAPNIATPINFMQSGFATGSATTLVVATGTMTVSSNTPIYLVARAGFAVSTLTVGGYILATRIR